MRHFTPLFVLLLLSNIAAAQLAPEHQISQPLPTGDPIAFNQPLINTPMDFQKDAPGTKNNDSCIENAAENEPIFVLRAQDASSPKVILHWIAKNFETCPDDKLIDAFNHAIKMKNWPDRKNAD
ncbi:hypothetical protein [Tellurirhabdus bombi]|uniref:hypothetical protein n=1 Tax=Tellurirhabdus bombi TaxID=2907205 RepID=UPI001F2691F4|nr:hypothetical protein [Tellurirhabdus bombi]